MYDLNKCDHVQNDSPIRMALPLMSPFFTLYNLPSLQVIDMRLKRKEKEKNTY